MKPVLLALAIASTAAVLALPQAPKPLAPKKTATPKYAAVQTIFNEHCIGCHGAERARAGINLSNYKAVMEGGEEGPIVKKGAPGHSLVVQAMRGAHGVRRMPPLGTRMEESKIKVVEAWILGGAKP